MSEIINETINELNKPTPNNIFSIEDDPVTILEKINQVERYLKQIDTSVDTSINTANEALEKANSAFEANGTLVKINGENQTTWSADFAESERQKSKNLFDLNYSGTFNSRTETSLSNFISMKSVYGEKFSINTDLPNYSFTRGSVGDIYTNIIFKNLKPNTSYIVSFTPISVSSVAEVHFLGVYNVQEKLNTRVTKSFITDENGTFNTGYGIWISEQNTTFVVSNIQLEAGSSATEYQPYYGEILHKGDIAPVVLYDQSSQNIFFGTAYPVGIPTQTEITSGVDFSPYKKLKVYYTHNKQYFGCADIDLTKQTFSTEGGNGTWCCLTDSGNAICAATFQVKTNSFKCTANGFTNISPLLYNSRPTTTHAGYYVYRIEGIK